MASPTIVPMFGLGVQEKNATATAQSRTNIYYEVQQDPDRTRVVAYGTPGLSLFVSLGAQPCRGAWMPPERNYAYFVNGTGFYEVNNAGIATLRGSLLTSSGRISMIDNGTQICIVDGSYGYIYNMDTLLFSQITDANFPNGADTVTWQDGFFLVNFGTDVYNSAYNDGLVWTGDFLTAESSPDSIVRVFSDHQEAIIFGTQSAEIWTNTGAADFPFERLPGAALEWGLAARDSVSKFDDAVMFLAQNRLGQVICARMQGYRITRVSNHDLEAKWRGFGNFADANAYSYMLDGHPMYVVHFPTGGQSWLYDGSSNAWTQLKSYGETRHRSDLHGVYFGRNLVTDFESGNIYNLDPDVYDENGDPLIRQIVGRHIFKDFTRMAIDAFQLDIETGVGLATGQGVNPMAILEISRDGGRTWGPQRLAPIGKVGKYKNRCIWRRCGRGRDFTFRVTISDPVKLAINGAGIRPRVGTS